MKTLEKTKNSKVRDIIIDESLDKLNDVVLFPEKVEEARRTIEKIGLPGDKKQNHQ